MLATYPPRIQTGESHYRQGDMPLLLMQGEPIASDTSREPFFVLLNFVFFSLKIYCIFLCIDSGGRHVAVKVEKLAISRQKMANISFLVA